QPTSLRGAKVKLFASRILFGVARYAPSAVKTTSGSRHPVGTATSAPKMTSKKMKLCAPSHFHDVRSLSWPVFLLARRLMESRTKNRRRTIPTVISHSRQQCCAVHQNGTPLRNPKNNGGPTGKSEPPMLLTRKMKNAMCIDAARPLFIEIQGRMRSIEAPIVPTRFASIAPTKRKRVFRIGLLGALTRR